MSETSPEGWKFVPLSNLARVVSGGTPSRDVNSYWGGDIPWVTPTDITRTNGRYLLETQENISRLGLSSSSATLLPPNAILMTSRATVGESRISVKEVCTNQGFKSLVPQKGVNGLFLYYQMQRLRGAYKLFGIGSTFLEVSKKDTERFSVLMPVSEGEQKAIAAVIDSVDVAIEKTEALIAKYQQIKAGLMHDLFTRGVTADGKLRPPREQAPELYQETPIGWIPKEWQYELLDQLAVRGSGHTPNKNFPEYWNGGIKWISLADSYRLDRLYITDTEYEISQLGIQNSSATVHPAGTVVISRDAGIGKSAITTEPMAVSQHFMCWRCDGRLDKHFLYYWLQFKKRMFENIAMGSTILTIGLPYFKKLKIAAPIDQEEQKQIGEGLLSIDKRIFSLEADLEKKRQQKLGLMSDLLTGIVRVQVAETQEGKPQ